MKKYLMGGFFILIMFFSFFVFVQATTGGPSVIYDLRYDSSSKLVYYLSADMGGRGCPPELKSLSLTGQSATIYSCDDAEKQADIDKDFTFSNYKQKINLFVEKLNFAKLINLRKNNITIETKVSKIRKCTQDRSWECGADFIATILQDNIKKAEIPFSACGADQPLIVDGYSLPGVTNKIVLMFSRVGICGEGGYTLESLHIVSGINIIDAGNVSSYKWSSPLVPHEGSLFVYANQKLDLTTQDKNNNSVANAQTPSPAFTQTLRYGTTNSVEVSKLQEFLIAKGYLSGIPNGMIYQTTLDAIKKFQLTNNLVADGVVGFNTRTVLNVLYPAWKNPSGSLEGNPICSSATMQALIDTTWPQPCNGQNSTECGVRQTGSTQINTNSCYVWAILPTYDDSVTSVLNSAIASTSTIMYTFPDLHTCRNNPTWTTTICP